MFAIDSIPATFASLKTVRDSAAILSPLSSELERLALQTYRQARKKVVLLLGSSILIVGLALIVLPGPAIVLIPIGLSILALEFAWARAWLQRIKQKIADGKGHIDKIIGGSVPEQSDA